MLLMILTAIPLVISQLRGRWHWRPGSYYSHNFRALLRTQTLFWTSARKASILTSQYLLPLSRPQPGIIRCVFDGTWRNRFHIQVDLALHILDWCRHKGHHDHHVLLEDILEPWTIWLSGNSCQSSWQLLLLRQHLDVLFLTSAKKNFFESSNTKLYLLMSIKWQWKLIM